MIKYQIANRCAAFKKGNRMNTKILILVLLFSMSCTVVKSDSTDKNNGIVYGKDHAFMISAPKGWILDNSSGVSQGLYAVFYPVGGSWKHSPAVMYANTASRKVEGNETREKLIKYDVSQFKKNNPDAIIGELPPVTTKDNKQAIIKTFSYPQYEAVAYIEEETITALLVLTARTKDQYKDALPAFREMVQSYIFLTKDVQFQEK